MKRNVGIGVESEEERGEERDEVGGWGGDRERRAIFPEPLSRLFSISLPTVLSVKDEEYETTQRDLQRWKIQQQTESDRRE